MKNWELNKKKYNDKYVRENYKVITLRVRKDDTEMLEHLKINNPTNRYILNLIRQDMKHRTVK